MATRRGAAVAIAVALVAAATPAARGEAAAPAEAAGGEATDETEEASELDDLGPWDGGGGAEDEMEASQPPQMTQEWWDLHYVAVLGKGNITSDPREPGDPQTEIFGNDLNDREHFEAALRHARGLLSQASPRLLEVLVLGCGLSPLVFALADRGLARVSCLEISPSLVAALRDAASGLPRPPRFFVGDVTAMPARRHDGAADGALAELSLLEPGGFDVVIDENVLDGMGCTFPVEAGQHQQRLTLEGIRWLLRREGRLLTLSFLPLDQPPAPDAPLKAWTRLDLPSAPVKAPFVEALERAPLHAALWAPPLGLSSS